MAEAYLERRNGPRLPVPSDVRTDRPLAVSVRIVDIGLPGVLLASSQPMQVGQHARIKIRAGADTIEADLAVRRVSPMRGDKGGYAIGARFVSLDDATRENIKRFLSIGDKS